MTDRKPYGNKPMGIEKRVKMADVQRMLKELIERRDLLDESILTLERLERISGKPRRGRPPAYMEDKTSSKKNSKTRQKQPPAELKDY